MTQLLIMLFGVGLFLALYIINNSRIREQTIAERLIHLEWEIEAYRKLWKNASSLIYQDPAYWSKKAKEYHKRIELLELEYCKLAFKKKIKENYKFLLDK